MLIDTASATTGPQGLAAGAAPPAGLIVDRDLVVLHAADGFETLAEPGDDLAGCAEPTLVAALRAALAGRTGLCAIALAGGDPAEIRCVPGRHDGRPVARAVVRHGRGPAETGETESAPLAVLALGSTRVLRDGAALDGSWLEQRVGELFKLLITHRDRVLRTEEIIEALWPDASLSAISNVRFVVHELRKRLDGPHRRPGGRESVVISHRGGYRLDGSRLRVDVDRFTELASRGLAEARSGDRGRARRALADAIALYRGDYLADEAYAEWAFAERERLQGIAAEVLGAASALAEQDGELATAQSAMERLAQLEPYDEDVQRRLIEICLARGRRSEAMRRYGTLEARLRRDLGEAPSFSFRSLAAPAVLPAAA